LGKGSFLDGNPLLLKKTNQLTLTTHGKLSTLSIEKKKRKTPTNNMVDMTSQVAPPSPMHHFAEPLQLTLEEAFYLKYKENCLEIKKDGGILNVQNIWKMCCDSQDNFMSRYVAYEYYRNKGWIPRCGFKFGTDFVLYSSSPTDVHAEYGVVVSTLDAKTKQPITPSKREGGTPLSWTFFTNTNRVCEQVAKGLKVCYILKPTHLGEEHFASPDCLKYFIVEEVVVNRWIPANCRD